MSGSRGLPHKENQVCCEHGYHVYFLQSHVDALEKNRIVGQSSMQFKPRVCHMFACMDSLGRKLGFELLEDLPSDRADP